MSAIRGQFEENTRVRAMTEHLDLDELVKILGHNLPTAAPSATQVSAPRSSWLQDVNASSPIA